MTQILVNIGSGAVTQQAITGNNVDQSSWRYCGIHVRPVSQEMLDAALPDMSLKIINLRLQPHLSGANEFTFPVPGSEYSAKRQYHSDSPYKQQLPLNLPWRGIYTTFWARDGVTHSFPNFKGTAVEVWKWIRNFIPYLMMGMLLFILAEMLIQASQRIPLVLWVASSLATIV